MCVLYVFYYIFSNERAVVIRYSVGKTGIKFVTQSLAVTKTTSYIHYWTC